MAWERWPCRSASVRLLARARYLVPSTVPFDGTVLLGWTVLRVAMR
jgi:hypothetical protein